MFVGIHPFFLQLIITDWFMWPSSSSDCIIGFYRAWAVGSVRLENPTSNWCRVLPLSLRNRRFIRRIWQTPEETLQCFRTCYSCIQGDSPSVGEDDLCESLTCTCLFALSSLPLLFCFGQYWTMIDRSSDLTVPNSHLHNTMSRIYFFLS